MNAKKDHLNLDHRITDVWDMDTSDNLQPLELFNEQHKNIYCAPSRHNASFKRIRKKTDK